jgi:hypothetical protein
MPLFDEAQHALQATFQDLNLGFEGIFRGVGDGVDGPKAVGPFEQDAVGADGISVMAWEWEVEHIGSFPDDLGIPATHQTVTLHGVTIIDGRHDRNDPQFARYIDWLGLYAQLGAVTFARPPVDDREVIRDNRPYPDDSDAG